MSSNPNPLNDLAGRFSKAPKGVGIGLKLLALGGAAVYGVNQSMYTGKLLFISNLEPKNIRYNDSIQDHPALEVIPVFHNVYRNTLETPLCNTPGALLQPFSFPCVTL